MIALSCPQLSFFLLLTDLHLLAQRKLHEKWMAKDPNIMPINQGMPTVHTVDADSLKTHTWYLLRHLVMLLMFYHCIQWRN